MVYILPYFFKATSKPNIRIAWCFLGNGGTALWQTDQETCSIETIVREYLEPNGFVGSVKGVVRNVCLFEIDPQRVNLKDFYSCYESGATAEVWRPFFWMGPMPSLDTDADWGWAEESRKMSLGSFGSVYSLWQVLSQVTSST